MNWISQEDNTVAIARGKEKEAFAKKLGAHHYIDSQASDPAAELNRLGGAKVVIATVTNAEAMAAVVGGLAPILGERDAVLESLATAIGDTIIEGLPASSLFVDPIAKAIANRFIAINYHKSASDSGKQRYQLTNRQMERVRDFVEANLDSDIHLEMMARVCGRSTEYFVRIFKATAGVSPYQYVLNLRIERAKALLGRDGPSIAEVALQCGFSHQEHLTRMFRRFTGVTPGRYRLSTR